mmetsp:Transcript_8643/g.14856  ORF Transcript_8643/g.14856 Transcript_8643/m.14856 type:complete len:84 (+) Transcript_8643:32-283(+)
MSSSYSVLKVVAAIGHFTGQQMIQYPSKDTTLRDWLPNIAKSWGKRWDITTSKKLDPKAKCLTVTAEKHCMTEPCRNFDVAET